MTSAELFEEWAKKSGAAAEPLAKIIKNSSLSDCMELWLEEEDNKNIKFREVNGIVRSLTIDTNKLDDLFKDWPFKTGLKKLLGTWPKNLRLRELGIIGETYIRQENHVDINQISIDQVSLEKLCISEIGVKNIDLKLCPALIELDIFENPIESIDLTENICLEYLSLMETFLEHIRVSSLKHLKDLTITWPGELGYQRKSFPYIPFSDLIDISSATNLQRLALENIGIRSIDLSYHRKLISLIIHNVPIVDINLLRNTELESIWIGDTYIDALDLSNCRNIKEVKFTGDFKNVKKIILNPRANPELDFNQNEVEIVRI